MCKGLKDQRTCQMDGCFWNPCVRPPASSGADLAPPADMKCAMGAPYFDDYVCGFSCPPTGYCKSNALPTAADALPTTAAGAIPTLNTDGSYTPAAAGAYPPAVVDTCNTFRNKESCPSTCNWEEFVPVKVPAFTRDFCHPVGDVKTFPSSAWESCLNQPAGTCAAPCVLNNGIDLISKTSDFCAPHYETKNVTHIQECVNADAAACVGECKWYKAPVVADNQQFKVGSDVFASNFCHPPVTAAWNMTAPACYANQDA